MFSELLLLRFTCQPARGNTTAVWSNHQLVSMFLAILYPPFLMYSCSLTGSKQVNLGLFASHRHLCAC